MSTCNHDSRQRRSQRRPRLRQRTEGDRQHSSTLEVEIDAAGIDTQYENRDAHLTCHRTHERGERLGHMPVSGLGNLSAGWGTFGDGGITIPLGGR